ncbi:MAG: hypothetical protein MUO40_07565 [Anaerolineaceae bacterium]|nr:hypothetical protein [Anaerolineaceae bacterium]
MQKLERIKLGLVIGALMGMFYALVNQLINRILLEGFHIYYKVDAPIYIILLITFLGALWGFFTSISTSKANSIVLGSILGALGMMVEALIFSDVLPRTIITIGNILFRTFLPGLIIFGVLSFMFRWVEGQLMKDYFTEEKFSVKRYLPIYLILIVSSGLGSMGLLPSEIRQDLRLVNAYMQKGASTKSVSELPSGLKGISGYQRHATIPYSLEPSDNIDLFTGEAPQGTGELSKGIVLVHFEDNYTLTCLTIDNSINVICENYVEPET